MQCLWCGAATVGFGVELRSIMGNARFSLASISILRRMDSATLARRWTEVRKDERIRHCGICFGSHAVDKDKMPQKHTG
jgi:hypothetical protein